MKAANLKHGSPVPLVTSPKIFFFQGEPQHKDTDMKSKKTSAVPLAKGQLWKMDDKHIEIMEVGKTLTHYRLFQNQKRVPISLGGISAVQAYLKTNGAKLIRKSAPVKLAA